MVDRPTVRTWLISSLTAAGFKGRGMVWQIAASEVEWTVRFENLPFGRRLGVEIRLHLPGVALTPPIHEGIVQTLEHLRATRDFAVAECLDMNSGMDAGLRRQELEGAMRAAIGYLAANTTIDSLTAAYQAGDFASAFIHRDVRKLLEGSYART
jgi:hypothetical protein